MKRRTDSYYLYLFIGLLMVVTIGYSFTLDYFQTKLLPIVIGGMILLLAAIGLRGEIIKGKEAETSAPGPGIEDGERSGGNFKGYLLAGGWIVGFSLAIYLVGFIIAIPCFVFSYLKVKETGWLKSIFYAGFIIALVYATFELTLKIILYRGVLFS